MSKEELEKKSMTALLRIASAWYDQMKAGEIPSISLPTRTKYNIEYDDASEVWKYGDKESMRTAASAKSATHLLEDGVRDRVCQSSNSSKTAHQR